MSGGVLDVECVGVGVGCVREALVFGAVGDVDALLDALFDTLVGALFEADVLTDLLGVADVRGTVDADWVVTTIATLVAALLATGWDGPASWLSGFFVLDGLCSSKVASTATVTANAPTTSSVQMLCRRSLRSTRSREPSSSSSNNGSRSLMRETL